VVSQLAFINAEVIRLIHLVCNC
jgi:hypothetical protein